MPQIPNLKHFLQHVSKQPPHSLSVERKKAHDTKKQGGGCERENVWEVEFLGFHSRSGHRDFQSPKYILPSLALLFMGQTLARQGEKWLRWLLEVRNQVNPILGLQVSQPQA